MIYNITRTSVSNDIEALSAMKQIASLLMLYAAIALETRRHLHIKSVVTRISGHSFMPCLSVIGEGVVELENKILSQ